MDAKKYNKVDEHLLKSIENGYFECDAITLSTPEPQCTIWKLLAKTMSFQIMAVFYPILCR